MLKKDTVTRSLLERRLRDQLRKKRNFAILESLIWLPLAVLYGVTGQWYVIPIIVVVILKVWQQLLLEKLIVLQKSLLDDLMTTLKDVNNIVDTVRPILRKAKAKEAK